LHRSITVRHLYLNPDNRQTRVFTQLRQSIEVARLEKRVLKVHPSLTTSDSQRLGTIGISVLAPTPETALGTVQGTDLEGGPLSSHTMSAVLMITSSDRPVAFLPGDLDDHGLRLLLESKEAKTAPLLLFPHHGGLARSPDLGRFAQQLYEVVKPHYVAFSTGRRRHGTPRAEIVAAIRRIAGDNVQFACTELSEWCAAELPYYQPRHLTPDPARGKSERSCCAGTMTITVGERELFVPEESEYCVFKRIYARSGLCSRRP
jgi:competence protein ComEC